MQKRESSEPSQDKISQRLDRYVDKSGLRQTMEEEDGKDYKKMYWDLVDKLREFIETI